MTDGPGHLRRWATRLVVPCLGVALGGWAYFGTSLYCGVHPPYTNLPFPLEALLCAIIAGLLMVPLLALAVQTPRWLQIFGGLLAVLTLVTVPLLFGLLAGSLVGAFPG